MESIYIFCLSYYTFIINRDVAEKEYKEIRYKKDKRSGIQVIFMTVQPPFKSERRVFMKRFRSVLIATILVFLMLPISAITISAEENTVWDGSIAKAFAGGSGTAEDPYLIQTASQFAFFSKSITLGISTYEGEYVKLENDIVLNDTSNWENWNKTAPANKWTPIGNGMFTFSGSFDGGGYTVSGVYINSSGDCLGLFGYLNDTATVANVGVVSSYIKGGSSIGGVVGYAFFCTVSNCYYTGIIKGNRAVGGVVGYLNGGSVKDCYNTSPVSGIADEENKDGIGGVIGYAISSSSESTVIDNCYNTGTVTGTGSQNGGIAGTAICYAISNCCNTGMVSGSRIIGGITGYANTCTINNCCNINNVSGTGKYVGGIAGWAISCSIDNCYNTGIINGDEKVGGVAGDISSYGSISGAIHNCYSIGMIGGNKKVGGITGWNLGVMGWFTSGAISNCYYLKETASGGIDSADFSDQAVGLTDTQLKQQNEYSGWDLTNVWTFGGNDSSYDYPTLIGVEQREINDTVTVMESNVDETTSSGGNYLVFIIIGCLVLAAGSLAVIVITSKKRQSE